METIPTAWILVLCVIALANFGSSDTSTSTPENDTTTQENQESNIELMSSICGPSPNEFIAEINNAYGKASQWLLDQRTPDWGWPFLSTATAILALQNTNSSWYSKGTEDLTAQLSIKQLEIELLAELSRSKLVDKNSSRKIRELPNLDPGNLAYYIIALNSTCHNVRNFYKNDLVEVLENSMRHFPEPNFNNYFQYGLALLALCKSGATIKTRYIREILDGQSEDGSYRYGTDVVSMALMAMVCVRDQVPPGYLTKYEKKIERSINYILSNQNEDHTFGNPSNTITTALAIQALAAAQPVASNWNCHNAVLSVLVAQEEEGHFGSQGGTIQILPFLAHKTFASVKDVQPDCQIVDTQGDAVESSDDVPKINITLVVENSVEPSAQHLSLTVEVPENSTLYNAMVIARNMHPEQFRFEAELGQWGHSIKRINDVQNDDTNYYYWTILIGAPERISAPTGADGIITEDQGVYIWYYKSFA